MKRLFDIFWVVVGLIILSPLVGWIAWRIYREDGGPVFYRGARVGRNGVPFRMVKFRTMVVDADKIGGSSTPEDDPRLTRVGRTLRKYKLDELPQLFNVLSGKMSLVGPRPEVQRFTDLFTPEEKVILSVRPGITDWASLWNADEGSLLAGAADPDKVYLERIRPTKIRLQLEYARNHSMFVDFKIILLTLWALVRPRSPMIAAARQRLGFQSSG